MEKIIFHKETKTFHLYNEEISYIMCVLENGHMGQLYYGKRIHDKPDFSYLVEKCGRPMTSYIFEGDRSFSLEHIRQEYPVYGTTDYRHPAIEIMQENGSNISEFKYVGYEILKGKPSLKGLPATYTESEEEAETLKIILKDDLTGAKLILLYTIFLILQPLIFFSPCFFLDNPRQSRYIVLPPYFELQSIRTANIFQSRRPL